MVALSCINPECHATLQYLIFGKRMPLLLWEMGGSGRVASVMVILFLFCLLYNMMLKDAGTVKDPPPQHGTIPCKFSVTETAKAQDTGQPLHSERRGGIATAPPLRRS